MSVFNCGLLAVRCRTVNVGVLLSLVAGSAASTAYGQVYNWVPWSSTGSQSASATDAGMGTVTVQTTAPTTNVTTPFPIQFDGVPFTPVNAPSVAVGNGQMQQWMFTVGFAGVANTNGVVVGLGNFGHGSNNYPGYRLAAFDTLGTPMPLTGFTQIGSYDHTWPASGGSQFNDDISLNVTTGWFTVTWVDGLNEFNSDILLLSLPAGVGRLEISTVANSGGDTVNVLVATPTPGAVSLLCVGGLVSLRRRR